MTKRVLLPTLWLCATLLPTTFAQAPSAHAERQAARRDGTISGRVVTGEGQPLSDARVLAVGVGAKLGAMQPAACDEEGNFKLIGLRQGVYRVWATMPGYVTLEPATESQLQRVGDHVSLTLVKGGVITGRVTDAYGEPLVGVRVMPRRVRDLAGRQTADAAAGFEGRGFGRLTDDRGGYRLYGLDPGVYVVSVDGGSQPVFSDGNLPRDTPTYYPAATRDTATEVNVRSGEEATGIDIRHRAWRGHIISGTIANQPEASSPFGVIPISLLDASNKQHVAVTMAFAGRGFALHGVPDGEYELTAESINESNGTFERNAAARRRVTLKGADVTGVELKLVKLGSIAGRVVIEPAPAGSACPDQESYVRAEISLRPHRVEPGVRAENSLPLPGAFNLDQNLSVPDDKGAFVLKSLSAGQYRLIADLPSENWYLRGITQPQTGAAKKPIDAWRNPLTLKPSENLSGIELIIATGAAAIGGRVLPTKEGVKLPPHLQVHLLPAETEAADDLLRYYETAARTDGSFALKHLAPGKYYLLARSTAEPASRTDQPRPLAWDAAERARLRREALATKNEIELKPCARVPDQALRF